ncbi:MAG: Allantoicase [Caeruleum heppii]|nr:MAG: Allantoicase [Caeruleum heppii]
MEIQALSPETIQDITSTPTPTPPDSSEITPIPASNIDTAFSDCITHQFIKDLTSSHLPSTHILALSDEFFAPATNLLSPHPPIHKPNTYVSTGAWYDGWETRRHNPGRFDWVIVRLGTGRGVVRGVEIDTGFFDGNQGEGVGVEGFCAEDRGSGGGGGRDEEGDGESEVDKMVKEWGGEPDEEEEEEERSEKKDTMVRHWTTILPRQPLRPASRHAWRLATHSPVAQKRFTHIRLLLYPDGGIARLRLYGIVPPPPPLLPPSSHTSHPSTSTSPSPSPTIDAASLLTGALTLRTSNAHYGSASNILLPGRGPPTIADGWETARSRTKGHKDWVVVRLGVELKVIERVVVDTRAFRGNFPGEVGVFGRRSGVVKGEKVEKEAEGKLTYKTPGWKVVLPLRKGEGDKEMVFEGEELTRWARGKGGGDDDGERENRGFTHVMLVIVPDGGVKRFRVWGRRALG